MDELCQGCPTEFLSFMKHCRNLNFEEKPDYEYLQQLLTGLAEKEGYNLDDKVYDWVIKDQRIPRPFIQQEDQNNEELAAEPNEAVE